jgi:hypothetical protein
MFRPERRRRFAGGEGQWEAFAVIGHHNKQRGFGRVFIMEDISQNHHRFRVFFDVGEHFLNKPEAVELHFFGQGIDVQIILNGDAALNAGVFFEIIAESALGIAHALIAEVEGARSRQMTRIWWMSPS